MDGNGWVTKAEAQQILDELCISDTDPNLSIPTYGDESPEEYKRMLAAVGIKI